ncbi:MAG: hypothetical protein UGF89_06530 [Acutalibacteraceae bacterium]|nr:hypothetical protein [Acutalibacteraceae bacterium]
MEKIRLNCNPKVKKTLSYLSWGVLILFLLSWFVGFCFALNYADSGPWNYSKERMTVYTDTKEQLALVDVNKVLKQKGEEPVYKITISDAEWDTDYGEVELTESDYKKYIGKGNNCIPMEYGCCKVVVNDKWFGKYTWKSHEFTVYRYCFPWGENTVSFSFEEIEDLKTAISENKMNTGFGDVPFIINGFEERVFW